MIELDEKLIKTFSFQRLKEFLKYLRNLFSDELEVFQKSISTYEYEDIYHCLIEFISNKRSILALESNVSYLSSLSSALETAIIQINSIKRNTEQNDFLLRSLDEKEDILTDFENKLVAKTFLFSNSKIDETKFSTAVFQTAFSAAAVSFSKSESIYLSIIRTLEKLIDFSIKNKILVDFHRPKLRPFAIVVDSIENRRKKVFPIAVVEMNSEIALERAKVLTSRLKFNSMIVALKLSKFINFQESFRYFFLKRTIENEIQSLCQRFIEEKFLKSSVLFKSFNIEKSIYQENQNKFDLTLEKFLSLTEEFLIQAFQLKNVKIFFTLEKLHNSNLWLSRALIWPKSNSFSAISNYLKYRILKNLKRKDEKIKKASKKLLESVNFIPLTESFFDLAEFLKDSELFKDQSLLEEIDIARLILNPVNYGSLSLYFKKPRLCSYKNFLYEEELY